MLPDIFTDWNGSFGDELPNLRINGFSVSLCQESLIGFFFQSLDRTCFQTSSKQIQCTKLYGVVKGSWAVSQNTVLCERR